jgi:hypothetical protein
MSCPSALPSGAPTAARWLALLFLVPLLGLGVGCQGASKAPPPVWQNSQLEASSENVLWLMTRNAFDRLGYPLGGGLDPAALTAVSGWRVSLAPFRGQGQRHRAEIRYTAAEPGRWDVEVRVQRQVNMDIVRPLDAGYAEWEWRPDDDTEARILLQHLRSSLGQPLDVGDVPAGRR